MMSLWLYRALIHAALPIAVPAIWVKDRLVGKARPRFVDRLFWRGRDMPRESIWIHAVSVGEVEIARRLLKELATTAPEMPALVTATTATGLALAERSLGEVVAVRPCPLDIPFAVGRVFAAARPRALIIVETELWPEMIHQAGRRDVPTVVVNGRLSEGSFAGYHRLRAVLKPLLAPLSLVAARSEDDAERFAALGVEASKIRVTGNIKYDLSPSPEPLEWAARVESLAGGRSIVVAGSTMEGEEEVVLDAMAGLKQRGHNALLVLAPRHPERFDTVAGMLDERAVTWVRRSTFADGPEHADVFLIDTIGELGRAYALGRAAFIGGSLAPTGGHNPLEPAAWGVPAITGPHVFNFREVYAEMIAAGAAVVVEDGDSLTDALATWIESPDSASRAGASGKKVVEANRGATARTVAALLEIVTNRSPGS